MNILESGFMDFELLLSEATPEQAPEVFRLLLRGGETIKMLFRMSD